MCGPSFVIGLRARQSVFIALAVFALFCGSFATANSPERADLALRELVSGVWIAGQINPRELPDLKDKGFRAVVALRPDGEEPAQPDAALMEREASRNGLAFDYVPVAGGATSIQVDALAKALSAAQGPIVLYCRSGRRAARTWALAEASRLDGRDAAQINSALIAADQAAPDLDTEISRRIAARAVAK